MKECTHQILDGLHDPLATAPGRTISDDADERKFGADSEYGSLPRDTNRVFLVPLLWN